MPSLLLVTAAYPPSRLIGGRRMRRFAQGLRDRGWTVTVLCPAPRYMQPLDPQNAPDPGIEVIHTPAFMPRVWLQRERPAASQPAVQASTSGRGPVNLRSLAGKALRHAEFPDEYAGWLAPALVAVRGRRFDVVLASAPPQTALVAGAGLAGRVGAKLVLDYRDPWLEVMSPDGGYGQDRAFAPWERTLHRWAEGHVLARADLVLGVTPRICQWLTPRTHAPVVFLPNSLDAVPPDPPLPRDEPLRLVYAGSLAYARSLEPVLRAMHGLRPEFGPGRLRLAYAGGHGAQLRQAAEAVGVADQLDDHGVLSHAASLALYRGAAAGIVSVSARTDYSYPGKLFEVLALGCPVFLTGPQDSEAARWVRSLGVGVVSDGADPAATTAALRDLLLNPPARPDQLDAWQAPVQVAELDQRLRALLPGP